MFRPIINLFEPVYRADEPLTENRQLTNDAHHSRSVRSALHYLKSHRTSAATTTTGDGELESKIHHHVPAARLDPTAIRLLPVADRPPEAD